MRRLMLLLGACALALAFAGVVTAATTAMLDPTSAAIGSNVKVINGCYRVVDPAPMEVRAAFLIDPLADPSAAAVPKTRAKLVAPWTYRFTVPEIAPGVYSVKLECAPDDWTTNQAEGAGSTQLTVLPTTSTEAASVTTTGDGSSMGPWLFLAAGSGILAAAAMFRRTTVRRLT